MKYILFLLITILFSSDKILAQDDSKELGKNKTIQNYLLLDKIEFDSIAKNEIIMKEVFISVNDSIKPKVITRRLRLFLNKTYNEKQLLITLKMDRHMKGTSSTFELDTTLKDNEVKHFKTIEEFLAYKKMLDSAFFGNKGLKVKTIIDTLNKKNLP